MGHRNHMHLGIFICRIFLKSSSNFYSTSASSNLSSAKKDLHTSHRHPSIYLSKWSFKNCNNGWTLDSNFWKIIMERLMRYYRRYRLSSRTCLNLGGSSLQNLEKQNKNWKQRKTDLIELPDKNNHLTGRRVGEHKRNTLSSYKQSNASMAHQL